MHGSKERIPLRNGKPRRDGKLAGNYCDVTIGRFREPWKHGLPSLWHY